MSAAGYTPRPGSKVALAVTALLDGPMTTSQLGPAMECETKNVNALLMAPLDHGLIIKLKDETGLLHFALGGMVVDERFTAHESGGTGKSSNALGRALTDAPLVRSVSFPSAPSLAAFASANLFGKKKVATAQELTKSTPTTAPTPPAPEPAKKSKASPPPQRHQVLRNSSPACSQTANS